MEAGHSTPSNSTTTSTHTHTLIPHSWATARTGQSQGYSECGQWVRGRQNPLPPITHGCSSCHLPGAATAQGTGSGRRSPHSRTGTRIHGLHHCKGPGLKGETRQNESGCTPPAKIPRPSAQMQETPPHPDSSCRRAASCSPLCSGTVAHQRC